MSDSLIETAVRIDDLARDAGLQYRIELVAGGERLKITSNDFTEPRPDDYADPEPLLGLATTRQLLDEIRSRIDTDYLQGGGGLDYTTVDGRPDESDRPYA